MSQARAFMDGPDSDRAEGSPRPRRHRFARGKAPNPLLPLLVGAAVAGLVVFGAGPGGFLLPRATTCTLGDLVGTYEIYTVLTPMNKPTGVDVGTVAATGGLNFTFTSGSLTVGGLRIGPGTAGWADYSPHDGISAMGAEENWSVYSVRNTTRLGEIAAPCTQAYVAEITPGSIPTCSGFLTLPLADNDSDTMEPHVWDGTGNDTGAGNGTYWWGYGCSAATPGARYWFDTSFHTGSAASAPAVTWNLCGDAGRHPLVVSGPVRVPIVVTVPSSGGPLSAHGFMSWDAGPGSSTANYSLPGGWIWQLAPVGPVSTPWHLPGPLSATVAFERASC